MPCVMTQGAPGFALLLLALLFGVLTCQPDTSDHEIRSSRPGSGERDHLSGRCEATLQGREGAPIRELNRPLPPVGAQPTVRFGDDGPPLGSVDGAAWSDAESSLYVLDGLSKRVRVYSRDGRHRHSFGDQGEGPGEFETVGEGGTLNRIAVGPDGHIAVRGHRKIHLFRRPDHFLRRIEPTQWLSGGLPVPNVAAFTDSSFLFTVTHAFHFDAGHETRSLIDIRSIQPGTSRSRLFAHIRNQLARLPESDSATFRKTAWTTVYDRLWDAQRPGLIATVSLERHGVCFFDASLDLVGAHRVQAPVVEVDGERKDYVVESARERYGPKAPMVGESWEEFYDYWPADLPRYVDIVLRPDSVAWLRRPTSDTWYDRSPTPESHAVDLVHATRGYLGTFESRRFPVAFMDDCPLVATTHVPESTDRLDSAFHGLEAYCPNPASGERRSGSNRIPANLEASGEQ